jgi:carbonic anhydrase
MSRGPSPCAGCARVLFVADTQPAQVVRAGQQLAEAEPSVAEPAVSVAEPAAAAATEPAVAAPEAPEGMEPAAAAQGGTPETPPLSAQMFPAVAGPGVVQEGYRPWGAMIPVQQPTQIEEAMMPQPGMVPAAQVTPQSGGAYAYAVYPGAKVQVAVTHAEAAPAAPAPTGDTCVDGKRQSPINMELNVEPAQLPVLAWRLTAPEVIDGIFAPVQEEGQGKWLRVVDAGLSMTVKGANYQLRSLIVHSPSEHTVSGQRYDMELQFLHSTMVGEQQQYLMVSALVNKADASAASPALSGLASKMQDLDTVGQISVNIRELALAVLGQTELVSPTATNAENYFMYDGSFTTSPCTEGVTWVILKNALQASAFDIETLAAALPQTNRPLQAVGQRMVKDRKVLGYSP